MNAARIAIGAACVVSVLLVIVIVQTISDLGPGGVGLPAPPFTGQTASGATISIDDYDSEVIVLEFWATWCSACRQKMSYMKLLQKEYRARGVSFVGVSLDDRSKALADYEEKEGINFPSIFTGAEKIADAYGVESLPTVVVIDREGVVVYSGRPEYTEDAIKAAL